MRDLKQKKTCIKILILLKVRSQTESILKPIEMMRMARINQSKVKSKTLKSQSLVLRFRNIFIWLRWTMNSTFLEKQTKMIQFLNVFQTLLLRKILDQCRRYLQRKKLKFQTNKTPGWITCLHTVRF